MPITSRVARALAAAGLPFAPVMFGEIDGQGVAAALPDGVPYCAPDQCRAAANEHGRPYVA